MPGVTVSIHPCTQVHKGHRFLPQVFKVATVCEYCSRLVPLLESGEVCEGDHVTSYLILVVEVDYFYVCV